jgi:hypothetical protein
VGYNTLVIDPPTAGRRLVAELPAAGVPVAAAFWGQRDEGDSWNLYVVTPAVDGVDARPTYRVLDQVLRPLAEAGQETIDGMAVRLIGTDTPAGRDATAAVAGLPARGRWLHYGGHFRSGTGMRVEFLYAPAA